MPSNQIFLLLLLSAATALRPSTHPKKPLTFIDIKLYLRRSLCDTERKKKIATHNLDKLVQMLK